MRSARARWWFIAIGNCNSSNGLYLKYDFIMTNGEKNEPFGFIYYQFSADEFCESLSFVQKLFHFTDILPSDVVFLTLELILLVAATTVACKQLVVVLIK